VTHTTLQGALEALYGLERRKAKLGLDGTRALLGALGNPERRFRAVHVAGTNGKGSTCALIERALRAAGVRTGLFTSPHLVDFRERIRVAGRWAEEACLFDTLRRIQALPEAADRTFFEVTTALGFAYFAAEDVEWAVVEVGLGGRLDTTNVLLPEVCAITSIGLDHTEILGATIEAIAFEKAGIVKPGVPVVVPALDARARRVIDEVAARSRAEVIEAVVPPGREGAAGFAASYQAANMATARAVLGVLARRGVAIPDAAIRRGFAAARWPGRFEAAPREPRLWWDGAHNPEGVAALERAWRDAGLPAPRAIVLAVSRDKDMAAMLAAIARLGRGATVFATRSHNERAADPARIVEAAPAAGLRALPAPDVVTACRAALDAAGPDGVALLTGSLFAVGEAMQAFGGAPGALL